MDLLRDRRVGELSSEDGLRTWANKLDQNWRSLDHNTSLRGRKQADRPHHQLLTEY